MRTTDFTLIVPESDDPDLTLAAYGDQSWDVYAAMCEAEYRRLMATDSKFRRWMIASAILNDESIVV
jgi:hypothetical protein